MKDTSKYIRDLKVFALTDYAERNDHKNISAKINQIDFSILSDLEVDEIMLSVVEEIV